MPSVSSQQMIKDANRRLGQCRIKLELRGKGDWIYLRGTLPPRPKSDKIKPYQQRVPIGIRATDREAVKEAIEIAKQIDLDLNRGLFDWRKFDGFEVDTEEAASQPQTVSDWVAVFSDEWWKTNSNQDTWRTKYAYPFKSLLKLHGNELMTIELLNRKCQN